RLASGAGISTEANTYSPQPAMNASSAMTAVNLAEQPRSLSLSGPWNNLRLASHPDCRLNTAGGRLRLDLPPLSGAVISTSLTTEQP
ncbi:MAG TPA: hypothetical protein VF498_04775, partial [Anaerolineales bacterium]